MPELLSPERTVNLLDVPGLLDYLRQRGGQEQQVTVCQYAAPTRKKAAPELREIGSYRLTMRGDQIEATGPSGQTRQLSPERFAEVFGGHLFAPPAATGRLTDLGPLFGG